ncbi:hypothetical protein [Aquabacterium sp.]|uniref:hypothetical protein n=1 Tax=Aquabacterium sp. TaxID=1872578 RepID=UPI002C2B96BE|nr:hypothetical protein [Aquabacterium sp.]HSW06512.1 hypothetical protein [Aquabacterium sp.]
MAISSTLILGLLGVAGLSVSASLALVAVTPGVGATGESGRQAPHRAPANAREDQVPVYSAPEHMPFPAHGSWEALFQARGG